MTQEQFKREKNYRVAISIAKNMLSNNIINSREYKKIDDKLIKKYKPLYAGL